MHGLGFMHVNEWHWHAPIPGVSFACVTLREGKAAIIGVRCDMGIDTESGVRLAVASEIGLKYEDTVIQEQRSDNSNYHFWQPGGSFGTNYITTQLILAARELKKKILEYAVRPKPGSISSARTPGIFSRIRSRKIWISKTAWFSRKRIRQTEDSEGSGGCFLER